MFQQLLDVLFPPRGRRARVRTLSMRTLRAHVQTIHTRSGSSVSTILPYNTPDAQDLIRTAKFDNSTHAQIMCARLVYEALEEYIAERMVFGESVILTTIPPSHARSAERGFNHLYTIATHIQKEGITYMPLLARVRDTVPQRTLNAQERLHNMSGAFTCTVTHIIENIHVIVLDDVVTTGSTLHEAHRALTQAGYHSISLWAIARA